MTIEQQRAGRVSGGDWMPWAVLTGLMTLGAAGGLGLLSAPTVARAITTAATPLRSAPSPLATPAAPGLPVAVAGAADSVGARHLLIQFKGTWKARPEVRLGREEARALAEEARARLQRGDDFAKVVAQYSNSPESAEGGGSLGRLARGAGMPQIVDAALALTVGQFSPVVETPFGFHIIQRLP